MPDERVVCHVLNTGWAVAPERLMLRGGTWSRLRIPVLIALFHHAREGWGLFDTGYATRVRQAAREWPLSLYTSLAPMTVDGDGAAAAQLHRFNLAPRDIAWIVVSHFHPDHIGGLCDFPEARLVAARPAYEDVRMRAGWGAVRRAFLPSLMPPDFEWRATLVDAIDGPGTPALAQTHDLFGDGLVTLCNLPGHACGQLGAVVRTTRGDLFFVADACWLSRSFREKRAPHWITRAFVDSFEAAERTVAVLHEYATEHPDTALVPSHCPEAYAQYVSGGQG